MAWFQRKPSVKIDDLGFTAELTAILDTNIEKHEDFCDIFGLTLDTRQSTTNLLIQFFKVKLDDGIFDIYTEGEYLFVIPTRFFKQLYTVYKKKTDPNFLLVIDTLIKQFIKYIASIVDVPVFYEKLNTLCGMYTFLQSFIKKDDLKKVLITLPWTNPGKIFEPDEFADAFAGESQNESYYGSDTPGKAETMAEINPLLNTPSEFFEVTSEEDVAKIFKRLNIPIDEDIDEIGETEYDDDNKEASLKTNESLVTKALTDPTCSHFKFEDLSLESKFYKNFFLQTIDEGIFKSGLDKLLKDGITKEIILHNLNEICFPLMPNVRLYFDKLFEVYKTGNPVFKLIEASLKEMLFKGISHATTGEQEIFGTRIITNTAILRGRKVLLSDRDHLLANKSGSEGQSIYTEQVYNDGEVKDDVDIKFKTDSEDVAKRIQSFVNREVCIQSQYLAEKFTGERVKKYLKTKLKSSALITDVIEDVIIKIKEKFVTEESGFYVPLTSIYFQAIITVKTRYRGGPERSIKFSVKLAPTDFVVERVSQEYIAKYKLPQRTDSEEESLFMSISESMHLIYETLHDPAQFSARFTANKIHKDVFRILLHLICVRKNSVKFIGTREKDALIEGSILTLLGAIGYPQLMRNIDEFFIDGKIQNLTGPLKELFKHIQTIFKTLSKEALKSLIDLNILPEIEPVIASISLTPRNNDAACEFSQTLSDKEFNSKIFRKIAHPEKIEERKEKMEKKEKKKGNPSEYTGIPKSRTITDLRERSANIDTSVVPVRAVSPSPMSGERGINYIGRAISRVRSAITPTSNKRETTQSKTIQSKKNKKGGKLLANKTFKMHRFKKLKNTIKKDKR